MEIQAVFAQLVPAIGGDLDVVGGQDERLDVERGAFQTVIQLRRLELEVAQVLDL